MRLVSIIYIEDWNLYSVRYGEDEGGEFTCQTGAKCTSFIACADVSKLKASNQTNMCISSVSIVI